MQFDLGLEAIPEHNTAKSNDPKSIDGILSRLTTIEQRLGIEDIEHSTNSRSEKNDMADLRKRLAHMESSVKNIRREVLKHQEAVIPIIEKELVRLAEQTEEGHKRVKDELVQVTDQVANAAASMIERILTDMSSLTDRMKKLEEIKTEIKAETRGGAVVTQARDSRVAMDALSTGSGSYVARSQSVASTKADDACSTISSEAYDLRSSIETMRKSVLGELSAHTKNGNMPKKQGTGTSTPLAGSVTLPMGQIPQHVSKSLGAHMQTFNVAIERALTQTSPSVDMYDAPTNVKHSRISRSCSPGPLPVNTIPPSTSPRERSMDTSSPLPQRWAAQAVPPPGMTSSSGHASSGQASRRAASHTLPNRHQGGYPQPGSGNRENPTPRFIIPGDLSSNRPTASPQPKKLY